MQVVETSTDGLKRGFTITLPASEIAKRRDAKLADMAKTLKLPGFRPGKVPQTIVKQRFGQAVLGEVLEQSVGDASKQVVSDRGLRPAVQPKIEVTQFADGTDLTFTMDVEVMPEIPLPDFRAIAIEKPVTEPTSETVAEALAEIAKRNRQLQDAAPEALEAGAQDGQVLVVDFLGKVDGVAFPGGAGTDTPVELGGQGFIPGFAEGMQGMKPGETRDVPVTFPEQYQAAELAGKAAVFTITAKALKVPVTPEIDDAMAKTLGLEDKAALEDAVKRQIQRDYDRLTRLRVKRSLLDQLSAKAEFQAPASMVDAEFEGIWSRVDADRKAGRLDADDAGKDEDTLKTEYRAIAERRVRLGLLLSEIGRMNSIAVTKEEMTRAVAAEASKYPGQEREVLNFFQSNPQAAEQLRAPVYEEKVVDFLLELATVTEKQVSFEELAKEPAA